MRKVRLSGGSGRPRRLLALLGWLLGPLGVFAQPDLPWNGSTQTIDYNGTFQDFTLPDLPNVDEAAFTLVGGDGGAAQVGDCRSGGGAGATVNITIGIGPGPDALPAGTVLRFIVGGVGESGQSGPVIGNGFSYGGGGGGTGLLYRLPDSTEWNILAVAGGGGGAYQGQLFFGCVDNEPGQGGRQVSFGGPGNGDVGEGTPGFSGQGGGGGGGSIPGLGAFFSAGGGGAFGEGDGVACINIGGPQGVGGGQPGMTEGGAGGNAEGCDLLSLVWRDGGYGFGGGGAAQGTGAGGGGYSGGGAGGTTGRGGGGGSFVNPVVLTASVTAGASTDTPDNGFIQYQFSQPATPPVAQCITDIVTVELGLSGVASITPDLIDAGSFDPDGEAISLSVAPTVLDCSLANQPSPVILTVTSADGESANCSTFVVAEDKLAPDIICPPDQLVSCDADTEPVALGSAIGSDNCILQDLAFEDVVIEGGCPDNRLIERRWTAVDQSGNEASCLQTITQEDNTPPVCMDCPDDITVNCNAVPPAPNVSAVDNCDPSPDVSLEIITTQGQPDGCIDFQFIERRIFTITDRCGNAQEYIQKITIVDLTAPEIVCPPDTMVVCDTSAAATGIPLAFDFCDDNPTLSHTDVVVAGDCHSGCTIERTWVAEDACGNRSSCVQVIERQPFFSVGQSLFIDTDGDGLANPLTLGFSRTTLTIGPEDAECVMGWLPGSTGTPTAMVYGNYEVDTTDCEPGANPLDANGQLENPLLVQGLLLAAQLRLDPGFDTTLLADLPCAVHPIILQALPNQATVGDLMEVTHYALANLMFTPHMNELLDALTCVNDQVDFCAPVDTTGAAPSMAAFVPPGQSTVTPAPAEPPRNGLAVYPNPARDHCLVNLSAFAERPATVRLYHLNGALIEEWRWTAAPADPVRIPLDHLPAGAYLVSAQTPGETVRTERLIVE